jgi:hypothetical protein
VGEGFGDESCADSDTITILIVRIGIEKSSHLKLLIARIVPPGLGLSASNSFEKIRLRKIRVNSVIEPRNRGHHYRTDFSR